MTASEQDAPPRTAGHRWWPAVLVLALVLGLAGYVWVRSRPEEARLDRPAVAPRDRDAAAADLLRRLGEALDDHDIAAARELADPDLADAVLELDALAANARSLRITGVELRYVDDAEETLSEADRSRLGPDVWTAEARLTWQFAGVDPGPTTVEVPVVLDWEGDEAVFVTSRITEGYRVPLWFTDRVTVRRTPRTLVLASDAAQAERLDVQAARAVEIVNATLPRWRGSLVVEAPRDMPRFEAGSGLSEESARAIAAVTTTTDGGTDPEVPRHIYLNPVVFEPLGPVGQQIVISHEATHVATDAVAARLPQWLSEGFADYVALADSDLPVTTLAAQIRELVQTEGAPRQLPGRAEFDGGNEDVGAWYEAAWLAVRLVADTYGHDAVLRFYRRSELDGDTDRAFRTVLGTTEQAFTAAWRDELVAVAR